MEIANVITIDGILPHKEQWVAEYQDAVKQVERLQQDIAACQAKMQALSGAVQACDFFLAKLQTASVETPPAA